MFPIILDDKTFIYNRYSLDEYLSSLGFYVRDLEEIYSEEANHRLDCLEASRDEYELAADYYSNQLVSLGNELEELVDNLASGKGGTKKEYAARIKNMIQYYIQ